MRTKILSKKVSKVLLTSFFIACFSSCEQEDDSIPEFYNIKFSIDGEVYDYQRTYDKHVVEKWDSEIYEFHFAAVFEGREFSWDNPPPTFDFEIKKDGAFEVGEVYTNADDIYYDLSLPEDTRDLGYEVVKDVQLQFDTLEENSVKGKLTMMVDYGGELEEHEIEFDFYDPDSHDILVSHVTPDPWDGGGNGDGDGDGDGGDGGSSGNCGLDNYNGPEFDVQVDSQCKLAYAYDCAGEIQARNAACDVYYEYGNAVWTGSGSLPNCPYCP